MRCGCFLLLAGLVLSGCSGEPLNLHPEVPAPGVADADKALLDGLAGIDRAMAQLQPQAYSSPAPRVDYVPVELLRPFDVSLSNVPIDQAASVLSGAAGYRLDVINPGKQPPLPVNLNGVRVPLIDLFRTLGQQGGTQVDISVNGDTRSVQVIYRRDASHA